MRSIPEDNPKPTLDAECRQTVLHTLCALVKWEPQREYLQWLMDVCRQVRVNQMLCGGNRKVISCGYVCESTDVHIPVLFVVFL